MVQKYNKSIFPFFHPTYLQKRMRSRVRLPMPLTFHTTTIVHNTDLGGSYGRKFSLNFITIICENKFLKGANKLFPHVKQPLKSCKLLVF